MSLIVNNNSAAFNVFSNFTQNATAMKSSMARLSSGVKAVADDPSGIGISERMRSQTRSSAMARANVENGISLLQTADSWLQKTSDMLARMHELAVEAKDGSKTTADKANIQSEFSELQDEILRVTSRSTAAAKFNGLYLFRGGNGVASPAGDAVGAGTIDLQIGADVGQTISLSLDDLQSTNTAVIGTVHSFTYSTNGNVTGSTHTAVKWNSVIDSNIMSVGSSNSVGMVSQAINHIANSRATVGAQQNRLMQTRSGLLSYEDNLRSAESKIRDVDVARESTEYARSQILTQIGNAILAQSNQLPSAAVQLLG